MGKGLWKPIKLSREGPSLSHIFFADDLLLFSEATVEQARVIQQCLDEFCRVSGQKVSKGKTRILFSKGMSNSLSLEICQVLGFARTHSLERYLGATVIQGRVDRQTFKNTVEKMKIKLSGWKANNVRVTAEAIGE